MTDKLAYTKIQILIGTFVGGPIAAIYFLRKNFMVMGDIEAAKKTINYGVAIIIALLAVFPFLPEFIPSVVYGVAYAATAQALYEQKQKSLATNPRYPHWNVAIVAIISVAVFIAIVVPLIYVYYAVGVLQD